MLYAVVGVLGGMEGVFVTSDAFWDVANEVHLAGVSGYVADQPEAHSTD
jgi:hypothetical protein